MSYLSPWECLKDWRKFWMKSFVLSFSVSLQNKVQPNSQRLLPWKFSPTWKVGNFNIHLISKGKTLRGNGVEEERGVWGLFVCNTHVPNWAEPSLVGLGSPHSLIFIVFLIFEFKFDIYSSISTGGWSELFVWVSINLCRVYQRGWCFLEVIADKSYHTSDRPANITLRTTFYMCLIINR